MGLSLTQLLNILSLIAMVWCGSLPALAQGEQTPSLVEPLLKLEPTFSVDSLKIAALWAPFFEVVKVTNVDAIHEVDQRIKKTTKSLTQSKDGEERARLTEILLESHLNLLKFKVDTLRTKAVEPGPVREQISRLHDKIREYAERWAVLAGEPKDKAFAVMYREIAVYLESGQVPDAEALARAKKKLPPQLARMADIVLALGKVDNNDPAPRTAEVLKIYGPKLTTAGNVLSHLYQARIRTHIDRDGTRLGEVDQSYLAELTEASRLAGVLVPAERRTVLNYALRIWRAAKGEGSDWQDPPLHLASFEDFSELQALEERRALDFVAVQQFKEAARRYQPIAATRKGTLQLQVFDRRILNLLLADYNRTQDPTLLDRAIGLYFVKYQNPTVLGKESTAALQDMRSDLRRMHKELIEHEYEVASAMQAAAPIRLRMIGMLRRYGKTVSKLEEWEELEVRIGTLFGLNARHSEALKTYLALARDKRLAPEKKIKYLGMAIDAQRAVASWVDPSPFVMAKKVFPDEVRPELEALRGLYQEYFKKTGGFSALDWKVLAHLGALNFVMSQEDAAAKQWLAGVKKDSRTEEAAAALGLLINHRLKAKDWDKLEEAARAAVVAGVAAQDMGKAVDARGALSIALWNGGQDDFRNKNYASCARRMKELIEKFAEHPQRDQAMALRHMALRKQGQHEEALAALVSLVDTYPESRVTGSMLGHGASYALDLAREDLAVRFYDLLLGSDETSAPAIVAREALIELYLATGQRQSAARELIALIATPHLTEDRVVFWGRQLVLLQEGLEGNGGALRAAEQVKQLVPTNPVAKALFYQQQLRFARSESKLDRLVELERAIDGEADRSRELGSVLAEARFSIAVSKGRRLAQDLKAPSGNNPMPAVKRQGEAVEKLRQNFTDVCVAARSRYCAEGQYEMIKVLRAVAEHYSGVELPEGTFDPETVREFRIRRDRILTDVGRWRDEGLKLVRQEVAKGSADPLWVKTTYINDRLLNRTPWLAGMGPSWYLQVGKSRSQASPPEAGEKVAH